MHINIRKFNYKSACEYKRFLTDAELQRSNRFKFLQGKERYILSKAWTREYISEILNIKPKSIKFEETESGKPYLIDYENIFFNISHSEDYFAIVVNEGRDVGIDIEKVRCSDNLDKLGEKAFGPKEIAQLRSVSDDTKRQHLFYHFWTRREAVIKCLSKKMAHNFKVDVCPSSEVLAIPKGCLPPFDCVEVYDIVDLLPDYTIAIATKTKNITSSGL